jgi:hypothetical protein
MSNMTFSHLVIHCLDGDGSLLLISKCGQKRGYCCNRDISSHHTHCYDMISTVQRKQFVNQ